MLALGDVLYEVAHLDAPHTVVLARIAAEVKAIPPNIALLRVPEMRSSIILTFLKRRVLMVEVVGDGDGGGAVRVLAEVVLVVLPLELNQEADLDEDDQSDLDADE
uniref:Uncharacterized protein n=1 Tax=Strombidium rassoulzadegani TaxID=1082188 RepID=A0A7S3FU62_9SPIT